MQSLFLIGLRGSGKSTVGQELAKKLALPFIDTDDIIEKTHAASICQIVQKYGWQTFRDYETQALKQIRSTSVVATGGGIVTQKANRELLTNKTCLYLQAPISILLKRLQQSADCNRRPQLYQTDSQPLSLQQELERALQEREQFYLILTKGNIFDATLPINTIVKNILTTIYSSQKII